ncbi:RNA polymerase sigma factor [Gracilimonas mengyeensis]|nr:RNA polymerase sigma factor [Gracilimonas mengyeensis]
MMKVKNGDLDKLGLLFERYHRPLFGYFYRMSKEQEVSEDLVQSVFERLLKYRQTYSGDGKFSTWLFSIARNAHIDHYRKEQRNGVTLEIDENRLEAEDNGQELLVRNKADKKEILEKALDLLEEEKREIIILSRYEGLKYKEIAELYDTTEGAVKVKMFRAMKELKNLVNQIDKDCSYG